MPEARGTHQSGVNALIKTPRAAFISKGDWSDNGSGIGDLTDGVTDEQFEGALTDARAEGNLSRANVVRKVTPRGRGFVEPAQRLAV